eukprot:1076672-Pelagomonas_calceolata.AAC.1
MLHGDVLCVPGNAPGEKGELQKGMKCWSHALHASKQLSERRWHKGIAQRDAAWRHTSRACTRRWGKR